MNEIQPYQNHGMTLQEQIAVERDVIKLRQQRHDATMKLIVDKLVLLTWLLLGAAHLATIILIFYIAITKAV